MVQEKRTFQATNVLHAMALENFVIFMVANMVINIQKNEQV